MMKQLYKKHQSKNEYWLLLSFVILKFIIQYSVINSSYDLHRDEYLHLDQGKHLAWGYISVPPFTSWTSHIILLLGNGVFWVKFFPALYGALTVVVVWFAIKELKGKLFSQALAAAALIFSVILRINILYQPNSFDILCWTLMYFCIIKHVNKENNKWLYLAAVIFAIGFLNKYNIIFLFAGLLPAIALTRHRKIFLNKHLYIALVLCILIISPNLIWQYHNNFPVYHHLKTLAATQLVNVQRTDFLKSQLLFFFNSIFVLIAALMSFFAYTPFAKYRMFFYSLIITLLLFVFLRAKDYYALGLYPILFSFGSVYLEYALRSKWKLYLRPIALIVVIVLFIPLLKVALPIYSPKEMERKSKDFKSLGLLRWEDGKDHILPQDFADMLGWRELANKVDIIYDTIKDKFHTLILCDNYGQAGAINYYSKNKLMAVSLNADYVNWFPPDSMIIKNVLFIKNNNDSNRKNEQPLFDTILNTGRIENRYAREQGTRIYLLKGAKSDINARLRKEIDERKKF